VDRITRKDLKSDKFALEVEHTVDYLSEHRKQAVRYGVAALAAVLIVAAVYFYFNRQQKARAAALSAALEIANAQVGPSRDPFLPSYPTAAAKETAQVKAFSDLAAQYAGSDEAYIAEYYLGTAAVTQNNTLEAEKRLKDVVDNGPANYASLAKLTLAEFYKGQGKTADGEKLLRSLIEKPTDFVSKEQASIALGQYLIASNPAEARKLLEPLRGSPRTVISQTAIGAMAELPPAPRK
jgi:predicted negative regulator of RcsB-dependent stress response